jgi:hypothetical protein
MHLFISDPFHAATEQENFRPGFAGDGLGGIGQGVVRRPVAVADDLQGQQQEDRKGGGQNQRRHGAGGGVSKVIRSAGHCGI